MSRDVNAPAWQAKDAGPPPELASVTSLGALLHVYSPRDDALKAYRPAAIIGGVLVAIGVLMALALVVLGGPWAALQACAVPSAIGVLVLAIYARTVQRLRSAAHCVVIYDDGFATLVGSTLGVWPWAEIASIVTKDVLVRSRRGATVWPIRRYEVSTRAGDSIVLLDDWFEDVRPIIATIKLQVFALLRSALQSTYASGAPVTFGPVTVSKDAIEADGRRLEWREVRDVVVKDGRLIATPKTGAPLTVRASNIPNIEVLGALIGVEPAKMQLAYR